MKSLRTALLIVSLAGAALAQNTAKFPTAVATEGDLGIAGNRAETTLIVGINATATTLNVLSGTQFKPGMYATIDNEFVAICNVSGNALTIGRSSCPNVDGRGLDVANGGGAAASHLAGAKVQGRISAWHQNQMAAEVIAVQKRLDGTSINLRERGAKCDGVTDDSAAVQAVFDQIPANPGLHIFVPGVCVSSAQLQIKAGHFQLYGLGPKAELRYNGTTDVDSVLLLSTDTPDVNYVWGAEIKDLLITGNAHTSYALQMKATHHSHFQRLDLWNVTQAGLKTEFNVSNTLVDVSVSCIKLEVCGTGVQPVNGMIFGGNAIHWGSTATSVINPVVEGVSGDGIVLNDAGPFVFTAGTSENNGGWGVVMGGAALINFLGIDLEMNAGGSIKLTGTSDSGFHHILADSAIVFESGTRGVTIAGSRIDGVVLDAGTENNVIRDNVMGIATGAMVTDNGTANSTFGNSNSNGHAYQQGLLGYALKIPTFSADTITAGTSTFTDSVQVETLLKFRDNNLAAQYVASVKASKADNFSGSLVLCGRLSSVDACGLEVNPYGQTNVVTGIYANGSGMKHGRFLSCTTAGVGSTCDTTIAWPVGPGSAPFPDANYTMSCTPADVIAGLPYVVGITSRTATGAVVSIANLSAAWATAYLNCIAIHD